MRQLTPIDVGYILCGVVLWTLLMLSVAQIVTGIQTLPGAKLELPHAAIFMGLLGLLSAAYEGDADGMGSSVVIVGISIIEMYHRSVC
jgi:hypothetical protein